MKKIKNLFKRLLPLDYHFKAVSIKHTFTKFKQFHYSQNGEDIVLELMFPPSYRGFYVDVGAHHPYRISNTYLLYQKGWRGVNIDANSETINFFNHKRKRDINIWTGIGKEIKAAPYYLFSDPAVNTFSETDAEIWKKKKFLKFLGTTQVPIKPLSEILNAHLPNNHQTIDVLNIDVEGLDLEVLESNNWNIYRPTVIVIEDHSFSITHMNTSPIYNYLTDKGYELVNKLQFTLIFKKTK